MASESMLTTADNPYNPFTQFDDWMAFDQQKGYFTLEYLARIAHTAIDLPDSINNEIIEDAINEIVEFNVLGIYQKVTKENFDSIKQQKLSEEVQSLLNQLHSNEEVETDEKDKEESTNE